MSSLVKLGQPIYHRKRKYFTLVATGDEIHEVNLDYITYLLIPVENPPTIIGQKRKEVSDE